MLVVNYNSRLHDDLEEIKEEINKLEIHRQQLLNSKYMTEFRTEEIKRTESYIKWLDELITLKERLVHSDSYHFDILSGAEVVPRECFDFIMPNASKEEKELFIKRTIAKKMVEALTPEISLKKESRPQYNQDLYIGSLFVARKGGVEE